MGHRMWNLEGTLLDVLEELRFACVKVGWDTHKHLIDEHTQQVPVYTA